jgi:spore germination protein
MLGLYGFLLAMLFMTAHLSSLESFKVPYLAPYNASDRNRFRDLKDTILRFPTFMQTTRPIFARENQRKRLRLKEARVNEDMAPGSERISNNYDSNKRGE